MIWKKLTHLLPWVRRAEDRDIQRELESLREMAGPGELGNLTLAAEDARGAFQFRWLEQLIQDARYARRSMWHDKVFSLLTIASLALGIGASTSIYSFMDAILIRPLPVSQPESLAVMKWRAKAYTLSSRGISWSTGGSTRDDNGVLSTSFPYPALEVFQQRSDVVKAAFGYAVASGLNIAVGNETAEASGHFVTGLYFEGMGVGATIGRLFSASDDTATAPPVAVVSERFAIRRFGDVRRAVGQVIRINDRPFDVVGVSPSSFFGAEPGALPDVFVPMRARLNLGFSGPDDFTEDHFYWLDVMVRLQPGVSMAQAQAVLAPVFHRYVENSAKDDKQRADLPALQVTSGLAGLDTLRRQYAEPIYILSAVVGAILLIACANIANLLLARAASRRREFAIRLSIGAARARVIRQLLTESVLLSLIGGAAGLLIAWWCIPVLTTLLSNGRSGFTLHAALNWRVLGIAFGLSTLTGMLFGLAPALKGTRVDIATALKAGPTAGGSARSGRSGVTRSLVVVQIAMSLVLLVAAGLFARTVGNLHDINVGFNRDNVLLFNLRPGAVGIVGAARMQLFEDLRMKIRATPGVTAVSLSSQPIPMGGGTSTQVEIVGTPTPLGADGRPPYAVILSVGPEFFSAMQMPLIGGREFTDRDRAGTEKVIVVNRHFGRVFGIANPVGHTVLTGKQQYTVVGVVDDALTFALKGTRQPAMYFPYLQIEQSPSNMTYEVRTAGHPVGLAPSVAQMVRQADWRLAMINVRTQAAHIDSGISREITLATLCSVFAIVALVIAAVGLYGMVAFSVSRRANEIGIRLALGATAKRIIWMVLGDVILMASVGLAIGLPLVFLGTKYVKSLLYGIEPTDPVAIAGALGLLLLSALVAGCGPAIRASRIAPMGAVRRE